MLVEEIMTRGAECLQPSNTLYEAAKRMDELNVGSLPVCGDDDALQGILTDRDIVVRAIAAGKDPGETQVCDTMTTEMIYCFEDQPIEDAACIMKHQQIRRLAVLNRDKRLTGIISLGDIAAKGNNDQLSGQALEEVSEPAIPER